MAACWAKSVVNGRSAATLTSSPLNAFLSLSSLPINRLILGDSLLLAVLVKLRNTSRRIRENDSLYPHARGNKFRRYSREGRKSCRWKMIGGREDSGLTACSDIPAAVSYLVISRKPFEY